YPVGLPYDVEISMGGPGGGSNAMISNINATEHLMYMNSTGQYNPVKAAYDAGSQTGETSVGVDVSYSGTTAYLNSGPSLVYGLWNNTYSQTNYKVNFEQKTAATEASIHFTGNVTSDFAGHLVYHQTGATGYGSSNNLTNFYLSYNATDLFIGLQEI
ncbi:MAG: thermopsin, partial [Candidatus Thermoplasmatota archaeon]|nr:thermopsin [Candidatus Thermoplasmatota archaeon]